MARKTFRERTSLVRETATVESIRLDGVEVARLVATDEGHEIRDPGRGTSEMLGFDAGDAGRMDMAVQYLIRLDRDER
jgi:hypothetical protein